MMKLGLAGIRLYPQTRGDFRVAQPFYVMKKNDRSSALG